MVSCYRCYYINSDHLNIKIRQVFKDNQHHRIINDCLNYQDQWKMFEAEKHEKCSNAVSTAGLCCKKVHLSVSADAKMISAI